MHPTQPLQFTQPMHPTQAAQPTFAKPPRIPADPTTPMLSATAALPTTADEPPTPALPITPEAPATPAEPTTPAAPTTPAEPTIPAAPVTPVEPATPDASATAAERQTRESNIEASFPGIAAPYTARAWTASVWCRFRLPGALEAAGLRVLQCANTSALAQHRVALAMDDQEEPDPRDGSRLPARLTEAGVCALAAGARANRPERA